MTYVSPLRRIIEDICKNSVITDKFIWEEDPAIFGWHIKNTNTDQEWIVRVKHIRNIIRFKNNPLYDVYIDFVSKKINAFEAKSLIDRLENIKAFW